MDPNYQIDLYLSTSNPSEKTGNPILTFWIKAGSLDYAQRAGKTFADYFLGTSGAEFVLVPEVTAL